MSVQSSEPIRSLSWRASLVRIPPFLLYWQLEFCCLGVVFLVYVLSFSSSVSVVSLSCVNCLHIALKSETNEGEHGWAYYLDSILAKKVCNIFLDHCSSCFCYSVSWHIRKMPPCRSALLVACNLHYHTERADGRFLQVEDLFCIHLRGDGVTGGSNFLVACSNIREQWLLQLFELQSTLCCTFVSKWMSNSVDGIVPHLNCCFSSPGLSVNVPC